MPVTDTDVSKEVLASGLYVCRSGQFRSLAASWIRVANRRPT